MAESTDHVAPACYQQRVGAMPDNPEKCRERAVNCRKLAVTASNETARQTFENLAATWERLAMSATKFLHADDIERK